MTTGSYSRDLRVDIGSGVLSGLFTSVVWNGTDRPKVTRSKEPPKYILRQFVTKDGLSKVAKIRVYGGRSPKPPKRADLTPHPFSKSVRYIYDEKIPHVTNSPGQGVNNPPVYDSSDNYYLYLHSFANIQQYALWNANEEIKLLNKLKERINGSEFNLGIALAECNQTLQMIGDSAVRINKSLTALKRGNMNLAAKWLMDGTGRSQRRRYSSNTQRSLSQSKLSSNWLELQYGWLPLLSDTKAGAEWLANRLEVPFKKSYRASGRVTIYEQTESAWMRKGPTGLWPCEPPPQSVMSSEYRKQIIAIVSEQPSIAVSLGLTDPLSIAWEKIPFSFVADWFIPIGDYLSARGFASSIKGTFVTTIKGTYGRTVYGNNNFTTPRYIGDRGMVLDRTVSESLDVPMPVFKQLGKAASWMHCANAVALLTQKKW